MINVDLWYLVLAQFIATIGGVAVAFIVEIIYNKTIGKREKLEELIEETVFLLNNEARYYSNPTNPSKLSNERYKEYEHSSDAIRNNASKLLAFASLHKCTFYKISSKDISKAGTILISISNSYFDSHYSLDNHKAREKIMKLLKI